MENGCADFYCIHYDECGSPADLKILFYFKPKGERPEWKCTGMLLWNPDIREFRVNRWFEDEGYYWIYQDFQVERATKASIDAANAALQVAK